VKIHTILNLFNNQLKLAVVADVVLVIVTHTVVAVVVDAVLAEATVMAAVVDAVAVINFLSISFNTCIIYP
jgi:hypothetical protein